MFSGVLPIGSVVLLKNSTKKLMIMGFAQVAADNPNKVYDYVGCVFPEGFLAPDQTFLFDSHQIEKIYAVGYQDEEQMQFKTRVDAALMELRKKENAERKDEQNEGDH